MSPSTEDKLISLLTEIHSDIRQMKSDLQSLIIFSNSNNRNRRRRRPAATTHRMTLSARRRARLKMSFAICGKRGGRTTRENEQRESNG
jgi:hypothetical protein